MTITKSRKYFGEKPLDGPVPFGSMYKRDVNVSVNQVDGNLRNRYYPSPEELAQYEKICEGSAAHIIALLDKEQINRHKISLQTVRVRAFVQGFSMFLAFSAILAIIAATIYLSAFGYYAQSIVMAVSGLLAIVLVYKYKKDSLNSAERRKFSNNRSRFKRPR